MTAIVIQARMNSRRLPGKVMRELNGVPVLKRVIDRCLKANLVTQVLVATSNNSFDDQIVSYCKSIGISSCRGDLDDVLSRFSLAVQKYELQSFVRITADCPLVDPNIIDMCIMIGIAEKYDYFALGGKYPDGLDSAFIKTECLLDANVHARSKFDREHVCPYIERYTNKFKVGYLDSFNSFENLRLTLDEEDDFLMLSQLLPILERKGYNKFSFLDIAYEFSQKNPVFSINNGIVLNTNQDEL